MKIQCGINCIEDDLTPDKDGRVSHADGTWHRPVRWTADQLMATVFAEPRWAVPGVIPEGLTLLVGGPKIGKSWFALNLAVAIALGGTALSNVDVSAGDVLYLALEDPPRRLQSRLVSVLEGHPGPARLTLDTAAGRGAEATEQVRLWLDDHPEARLVVVDVLAKVRPVDGTDDRYAADYRTSSVFKSLADEYGVAVLVVHHTRKQQGDDFVDLISGTNGLAGAADTVCVLRRARTEADAILSITGRDVAEAEHALTLTSGRWTMLDGPATDYALSRTAQAIRRSLRETGAATPKELAERLGLDHENAKKTCRRLSDQGYLSTNGRGIYSVSLSSPMSPDPGSPGETSGTLDPASSPPCSPASADTGGQKGHDRDGTVRDVSAAHDSRRDTRDNGDMFLCAACGEPLPADLTPDDAPVHFDPDCLARYREQEAMG